MNGYRCKCGLLHGKYLVGEICEDCKTTVSWRKDEAGEEIVDNDARVLSGHDIFGKPLPLLSCRCGHTTSSNLSTVCKHCGGEVHIPVRVCLKFKEVK